MLMRKCTKEYDPDSDDPKKQLTNTTQNRGEDLYGITELIDPSYEWYDSIYHQTMDVFKDVVYQGKIYRKIFLLRVIIW